MQTGGFGGNPTLQSGDFQAAATAPAAGSLSNAASNGEWSVGSLDAAGRAAINRTGTTQMRVAFALDDNDSLSVDRIRYDSGDSTTPAFRPELVVTYVE